MKTTNTTLFEKIQALDKQTSSPKDIARARKNHLDKDGNQKEEEGLVGVGLPSVVVTIFRQAVNEWINVLSSTKDNNKEEGYDDEHSLLSLLLEQREESVSIKLILSILIRITKMDSTFDEELAKEGSHVMLSKIINIDVDEITTNINNEDDDKDCVIFLQDMASEIAVAATSYSTTIFPTRISPYSTDELIKRLPIPFPIFSADSLSSKTEIDDDDEEEVERNGGIFILINQVNIRQSAQKDVGFVMWPSAVALSRWLLFNSTELEGGKSILELGAGCGLCGMVAARIILKQQGQQQKQTQTQPNVTITDFNELVIKNIKQNISLNGIECIAEARGLDFYDQDPTQDGWIEADNTKTFMSQVDLILAADVICRPDDAYAAARSIQAALKPGGKAVTISGDLKHRYGVECFEGACTDLGLNVSKHNVADLYEGKLIATNMEKTSGYVDGMTLSMFIVNKEQDLGVK